MKKIVIWVVVKMSLPQDRRKGQQRKLEDKREVEELVRVVDQEDRGVLEEEVDNHIQNNIDRMQGLGVEVELEVEVAHTVEVEV